MCTDNYNIFIFAQKWYDDLDKKRRMLFRFIELIQPSSIKYWIINSTLIKRTQCLRETNCIWDYIKYVSALQWILINNHLSKTLSTISILLRCSWHLTIFLLQRVYAETAFIVRQDCEHKRCRILISDRSFGTQIHTHSILTMRIQIRRDAFVCRMRVRVLKINFNDFVKNMLPVWWRVSIKIL